MKDEANDNRRIDRNEEERDRNRGSCGSRAARRAHHRIRQRHAANLVSVRRSRVARSSCDARSGRQRRGATVGAAIATVRGEYVDLDNDGVCDNYGTGNGTGGQGSCAGYVDADGDGICDNCANGQGSCPGYADADGNGVCDNYANGCGNGRGSGYGCGNGNGGGAGYVDADGDGICDNYGAGNGRGHHGMRR